MPSINISMTNYNLDTDHIIHWINAVRDLPDGEKNRMLESLYSGQLYSKIWLIDTLVKHANRGRYNVYIFGGWTGILASMLFQSQKIEIGKIRSIDLDPWCERVADTVNKEYEMAGWRFKAITHNMMEYEYDWDIQPHIVINTSSEHVDQTTYEMWYDRIPPKTLVVVQGNNYFNHPEHLRCSHSLEEFETMNLVGDSLFSGQLHTNEYTRYMSIWRK
jgi:hypothetical protein